MKTWLTASPAPASTSAIAVPETTETSCSADGPPSRTATGGQLRSAAVILASRRSRSIVRRGPRPAGPVADEHDLGHQLHAGGFDHRGANPVHQPAHVGGGPLAVVDDEVGVLLGDRRATLRQALQASIVDQLAGGGLGTRVPERAARRRQAQGLVGLAPAPDVVESLLALARRRRLEAEASPEDALRRPVGCLVLEPALAVAEAELVGREPGLGAVGLQDVCGLEDRAHVRAVCARVRPDRAAGGARDRKPELEAGQARALGLRGGSRHGDAGLGDVRPAVDLAALRANVDDEAAHAAVGDDRVAPPSEEGQGQLARAREPHQRSQLECVVCRREQVGRAAHPHRRELRQRGVSLRLHADAAGDLARERDEVERRPGGAHAGWPAAMLATVSADGSGRRSARATTSSATAAAAPGLPNARAAALIATCLAGSSRIESESRSEAPSKSSFSTRRAAPDSASSTALRRWCAPAYMYGTTTMGTPSAVTSAMVEDPARPTTRSAAASASSSSSPRKAEG